MTIKFEPIDGLWPDESPVERKMPEGGWKKPCSFEDHKWVVNIEDGRAILVCADQHPVSFLDEIDPAGPLPTCRVDWMPEDIHLVGIPVTVTYVDDSTPSTPAGPAEYGYYLEIAVDKDRLMAEEHAA